jgi:hypothetical protein
MREGGGCTNRLIHGHGSCQRRRHDPGKLHPISQVHRICFGARCVGPRTIPEHTYRSRFRSRSAWGGSGSGWPPSRGQAVGHQGHRACRTSSQASQLPLSAGRPASRGRAPGHCLRGVSDVARAEFNAASTYPAARKCSGRIVSHCLCFAVPGTQCGANSRHCLGSGAHLGSNRRHLGGSKRLSRFSRLDAQFAGREKKMRELALRTLGTWLSGCYGSQARC